MPRVVEVVSESVCRVSKLASRSTSARRRSGDTPATARATRGSTSGRTVPLCAKSAGASMRKRTNVTLCMDDLDRDAWAAFLQRFRLRGPGWLRACEEH